MLVKKLTLKNFRNHSYLSYDFVPGMNILVGPNTAGKTNVTESIYYLSIAKSFRTDEDKELITNSKDKAEIEAICSEGQLNRKIKIIITREGRQILLNGKPTTRSECFAFWTKRRFDVSRFTQNKKNFFRYKSL